MNKQRGFTLIEVMIVLAILGAMVVFGAPRLMKKDNNIKAVTRHFLVLSKEIRNKARLSNSTYRLVINLDEKSNTYWVEKATGAKLLDPDEAAKEKERKEHEDKEHPAPPMFTMDKSLTKKQETLPGEIRFTSVETINSKEAMTSGLAYVYFFPEGFVEASTVQITNGPKNVFTLIFNPLTGQADIVPKAQSLKDIQR
jgi:general secretion pathway protein H